MSGKRLYAITSFHTLESAEENERNRGVIEVRAKMIEAIASCLSDGNFYCDNVDRKIASQINEILDTKSLEDIEDLNGRALELGNSVEYEFGTMMEALIRARLTGSRFLFAHTEPHDPEGAVLMEDEFYDEPEFLEALEAADVSTKGGSEKLANFLQQRMIEIRDRKMIRNIEINGAEENILYVGSAHSLIALQKSVLTWYRIHIEATPFEQIHLSGFIPRKFRRTMTELIGKKVFDKDATTLIRYL